LALGSSLSFARMRRSSRAPRGGQATTAASLPPHVAAGLLALVETDAGAVGKMLSAPAESAGSLAGAYTRSLFSST
jgi:hypothetical protein